MKRVYGSKHEYQYHGQTQQQKTPLIEFQDDGSLIVYIREVATEGQANLALIILLSEHYHVAKSRITILRGRTSHHKVISVEY